MRPRRDSLKYSLNIDDSTSRKNESYNQSPSKHKFFDDDYSVLDRKDLPISKNQLSWENFTTDLYSTEFEWKEIVNEVRENPNQRLDLRPYMV